MIHLNPFAISGLLIVATYLPLILFIMIRGKTLLTRIFSLYMLSACLWGLGSFLIGIAPTKTLAIWAWKFATPPVMALAVFLLHSVILLTKEKGRLLLIIAYGLAAYFIIGVYSGLLMNDVVWTFDSFYSHVGTRTYLYSFIFWMTCTTLGHIKLIQYYKRCFPHERKQILALIFAGVGFLGGALNFLPGLGIEIYPYANFLIPLHGIMVTHAILRHQLLDIDLAFNRGLVYSLLIFILSSLYMLMVMVLEKILQYTFNYHSATISLMAAFVIGLIFFPLRSKIQTMVDRRIFHKSPQEIAHENERLWVELAKAERLRAAATLASGVAHEVKNPLTAIQTFTEYLPKKQDDPEFLANFARIVGQEVSRINNLVQQLLDFARPEPLTIQSCDINARIKDLLAILTPRCLNQHIRVHFNPAGGPPLILAADDAKIKQALLNILLNAIEVMPTGGDLTVETGPAVTAHGPGVEVRVTDTGPGIRARDRDHLFDPFFTKKETGTGLGLAITHGIIRDHQGTITLQTALRRGTTFIIQLPFAPPPKQPAEHPTPGGDHDKA